jgi:hypothetical protein
MPMKKAEMEAHSSAYFAALAYAEASEEKGMYRPAMTAALSAWEHVDGMMQYARKYQNTEAPKITAIDMVLRYAPLLLDAESLTKLDALLTEIRRISRDAATDIPAALAGAQKQILDNHRLWKKLEASPETREDFLYNELGGRQEYWSSVIISWSKMGLVTRKAQWHSFQIALTTRMGQVVRGKCPSCGTISEAPKAMLLEPTHCPQCKSTVSFVILPPASD